MTRLPPPELVDLIPAEDVRSIISRTDCELAALERQAAEATSSAEREEDRVRDLGVDGEASTWAMVRLRRFLDGLRAETEQEVDSIVDLAREHASLYVEQAKREAARSSKGKATHDGEQPTAEPPEREPGAASAAEIAADAEPAANGAPSASHVASEPQPSPTGMISYRPTEVASTPLSLVSRAAPAENGQSPVEAAGVALTVAGPDGAPVVPHGPVEGQEDAGSALLESPGGLHEGSASSGVVTTLPVAPAQEFDDPLAHDDTQAGPEFWPEVPPKRSFIRRIPISAVLEVLAVILILVFILLRLS
jgi:hypothetical protein